MDNITATLPAGIGPFNGRNYAGEKELSGLVRVVAYNAQGAFREPVAINFYTGRSSSASRVYCSIWIRAEGIECSGRGHAGGGGYHKPSAALAAALDSAHVELSQDIDGRGSNATRDAAVAIARALGFLDFHVVEWGTF